MSARFEALLCLRRVSCHVAAADLEAAAVVGFAVHVVQALAAYERGEERLVDRQAHCVMVWDALLNLQHGLATGLLGAVGARICDAGPVEAQRLV